MDLALALLRILAGAAVVVFSLAFSGAVLFKVVQVCWWMISGKL